ncbi:TolC family protein [Rubinisphaera italica]|nr:TolC family protein [Rubinisphaera italica]
MNRLRGWKSLQLMLALLVPVSSGCQVGFPKYYFLGKPKPQLEQYRETGQEIDYPNVAQAHPPEIETTAPPRTVANSDAARDEIWDLGLQEAVHLSLANSDVIRSAGQFLSPNNSLLANPTQTASIYDPAIQDSGVLFGGVGTEAALADFDATLTSSLTYGRNETVQNNPFFGGAPGGVLEQETGAFNTALTKNFAYGANFSLAHEVNYSSSNAQGLLFPSTYTGNVQARYRQQLLSGSGADFVRVAGPLSDGFAGITGVSNGVLIARINADISITQFEANVRNLIKDVEDTYWDLYLAYRNFDTSVTARNTALDTWRVAKAKRDLGGVRGFTNSEEAQARDRYFETRAQAENSLGTLYVTEQRLRELLGLPVNDRKVIRPADDPIAARLQADWYQALALGLTERVEVRRQKWNIKSLELQLGAAKNLARPRLDLIAQYQVNGFGDHLLANSDLDKNGGDLNSFYGKIAEGEETGYTYGLEFSMPFGLRQAKSQVRNIELRLTKARKVLAAQELEVGHEIAVSFQQLETSYATAVSNFSRRSAALERVRMIGQELEVGSGSNTLDRYLRAQESLAAAENSYHQSLVDYNKAIVNMYFRQGTLLQQDNIHLMEGKWDPEAYRQAFARAKSRAHAIPAPHLRTVPEAFAADGHNDEVGFAAPEASQQPWNPEMGLEPYPEELPLPIDALNPQEAEAMDNLEVPPAPGEMKKESDKPNYFENDKSPQLIQPNPIEGQDVRMENKTPAIEQSVTSQKPVVPVLKETESFQATSVSQIPEASKKRGRVQLPEIMQTNGIKNALGHMDKEQSTIQNANMEWQSAPKAGKPSLPVGKTSMKMLSPENATRSQPSPFPEVEVKAPESSPSRMAHDLGKAIPAYK